MKEFYVAPEAEIIRFAAEENIANQTSDIDWVIEHDKNADGGFANQGKWF